MDQAEAVDEEDHHPSDEEDSSIRAVLETPRRGRIVIMGFPGLAIGIDGSSHIDPDALHHTLRGAADLQVRFLMVLTEAVDVPTGAHRLLRDRARAQGLRTIYAPVVDFGIPDAAFLRAWRKIAPSLHDVLDDDGTIGLTCSYGAGRSGTIAALMLIERGLAPEAAIDRVREGFHEAIESTVQIDWLMSLERQPA